MARTLALLALAALGLAAVPALAEDVSGYRLESELKLPGKKVAWDYLFFDDHTRRLFISRGPMGVSVYAPDTKELQGPIAQSEGAHGVALASDLGRGYTSNADGTATVFDLASLKTIAHIKVAPDNDAATYDPVSKRVIFINGDSSSATFLDATTNTVLGTVALDSRKPEFPSVDDRGRLYDAIQDKNEIAVLDTNAMKQLARWPTGACALPTATRMDIADHRLFVGCRGDAPVLAVIDTDSGAVVATLPIGHGVDAVDYDPGTKTIYASNGIDSNFVVIDQSGPDTYKLNETVYTRPATRTSALDPKTKKFYTVTAEFSVAGALVDRKNTRYVPDSFTLLTYSK